MLFFGRRQWAPVEYMLAELRVSTGMEYSRHPMAIPYRPSSVSGWHAGLTGAWTSLTPFLFPFRGDLVWTKSLPFFRVHIIPSCPKLQDINRVTSVCLHLCLISSVPGSLAGLWASQIRAFTTSLNWDVETLWESCLAGQIGLTLFPPSAAGYRETCVFLPQQWITGASALTVAKPGV